MKDFRESSDGETNLSPRRGLGPAERGALWQLYCNSYRIIDNPTSDSLLTRAEFDALLDEQLQDGASPNDLVKFVESLTESPLQISGVIKGQLLQVLLAARLLNLNPLLRSRVEWGEKSEERKFVMIVAELSLITNLPPHAIGALIQMRTRLATLQKEGVLSSHESHISMETAVAIVRNAETIQAD